MKRALAILLLSTFAAAGGAAAQAPPEAVLSAADLDQERAGLRTSDGLDIGFGAVVRTAVDGGVVLETTMKWTEGGIARTVSRPGGGDAGPAGSSRPGAGERVVLPGDNGTTEVIHNLSPDSIANLVVNTASNRTIVQETGIELMIPGFERMQQDFAGQRLALRLQDAVGLALRDGALK